MRPVRSWHGLFRGRVRRVSDVSRWRGVSWRHVSSPLRRGLVRARLWPRSLPPLPSWLVDGRYWCELLRQFLRRGHFPRGHGRRERGRVCAMPRWDVLAGRGRDGLHVVPRGHGQQCFRRVKRVHLRHVRDRSLRRHGLVNLQRVPVGLVRGR
jgi:hypothetical protein